MENMYNNNFNRTTTPGPSSFDSESTENPRCHHCCPHYCSFKPNNLGVFDYLIPNFAKSWKFWSGVMFLVTLNEVKEVVMLRR